MPSPARGTTGDQPPGGLPVLSDVVLTAESTSRMRPASGAHGPPPVTGPHLPHAPAGTRCRTRPHGTPRPTDHPAGRGQRHDDEQAGPLPGRGRQVTAPLLAARILDLTPNAVAGRVLKPDYELPVSLGCVAPVWPTRPASPAAARLPGRQGSRSRRIHRQPARIGVAGHRLARAAVRPSVMTPGTAAGTPHAAPHVPVPTLEVAVVLVHGHRDFRNPAGRPPSQAA